MNEDFLHYVWQYQKFDTLHLKTTKGEALHVIQKGQHNKSGSGPDFKEAILKIGDQKWAGQVEIHRQSSDWYAHHHERDTNYDNVILHAVWYDDVEVFDANQNPIPTLIISDCVQSKALENYQALLSHSGQRWINCANDFHSFSDFTFENWLERLYIERLEVKSQVIQQLLAASKNHWDAVCFQYLARNFGLNTNGEQFLKIAESINYKIIQKLQAQPHQIEALLFGQSGLIPNQVEHPDVKRYQQDYVFLKEKYQLTPRQEKLEFFRLRPSNFPSLRLAQLAALLAKKNHLCERMLQVNSQQEARDFFKIELSDFWKTHYTFQKESKKSSKKLSRSFVDLMVINTIVPLKFAYHQHFGQLDFEKQIFPLISAIKPERNSIVTTFEKLRHHKMKSAVQSQALIHLKKNYCDQNRCLSCNFGLKLVRG
ncbi:MAG: DUF2851 family protein [Psychroflexus sp.]|nr:DUF2851 family protein [Psychroflexus sp.]MDN6310460.1 DUF2851 family protein [Psychroflexus sp.]